MARGLFSRYEHHQRRWNRIKNDPILYDRYKKRIKEYYLKIKGSPKRRRELKARRKRYILEMRAIAREVGNCTHCFQPKEDKKYLYCLRCRERSRIYYKRHPKKSSKKNLEEGTPDYEGCTISY